MCRCFSIWGLLFESQACLVTLRLCCKDAISWCRRAHITHGQEQTRRQALPPMPWKHIVSLRTIIAKIFAVSDDLCILCMLDFGADRTFRRTNAHTNAHACAHTHVFVQKRERGDGKILIPCAYKYAMQDSRNIFFPFVYQEKVETDNS